VWSGGRAEHRGETRLVFAAGKSKLRGSLVIQTLQNTPSNLKINFFVELLLETFVEVPL
jgi:hypothetical protein